MIRAVLIACCVALLAQPFSQAAAQPDKIKSTSSAPQACQLAAQILAAYGGETNFQASLYARLAWCWQIHADFFALRRCQHIVMPKFSTKAMRFARK